MQITIVLIILFIAIILFATEWLRMDVVSLLILVALGVTGLVTVEEAFAGFSNPAVITVAAMFVLSAAITNVGALGRADEYIIKLAEGSEARLIAVLMVVVAFSSAFINNIGSTAVLMPVVVSVAQKVKISPSKLLIPLAFGSLLGGVCTKIGTPPNILMDTLLTQYSGESLSMFDFTPAGLVIVTLGILYMTFWGRHLLPTRKSGTLTEEYQVKEYISEMVVLEGSLLIGLTIAGSSLERDFNLKVRAILRGKQKIPNPRRNNKLREGDILFLEGNPEGILRARATKGLEMMPERDNPSSETPDGDTVVVEASLSPTCDMVGKTLREVEFRDTHGLTVLAIWRQGAPVVKKVDHVRLKFGDVLLLQGPEAKIVHLGREHGFLLLGGVPPVKYRPDKAPLAIGVLIMVIALAAIGWIPIMLSATLGVLLMILLGCLSVQNAYEAVDWRIIVMIAGTLPLGMALEKSGAASMLAHFLVVGIGSYGPWVTLAAIVLVTSLLTEVMSHAAAAVLIAPIAYNISLELGVDPKPFFMAVAVAASSCFMTPVSHQSNALVMGPGGYKFLDFTKVGAPLNVIVWLVASLLVPIIFPF